MNEQIIQIYQKLKKLMEDEIPNNNAGSGNIAGIGVGSQGEPGVNMKFRDKNKKNKFLSMQDIRNIMNIINMKE